MEPIYYLVNTKTLLDEANKYLEKIPCECDSYNGFVCNVHDWERQLTRLRNELNNAIENQE